MKVLCYGLYKDWNCDDSWGVYFHTKTHMFSIKRSLPCFPHGKSVMFSPQIKSNNRLNLGTSRTNSEISESTRAYFGNSRNSWRRKPSRASHFAVRWCLQEIRVVSLIGCYLREKKTRATSNQTLRMSPNAILVPRSSVSFGHVVGRRKEKKRGALGTRMPEVLVARSAAGQG